MNPILIRFDENAFNTHLGAFKPTLTALNVILSTYNNLGLQSLTEVEFKQLFTYFDEIMFDKMTFGKPIEIGGFEIDKQQAIKILKKPVGYTNLQSLVNTYNEMLHSQTVLRNANLVNNKVFINDSFIDNEKKKFQTWATTEKQIKAYEFTQKVIEAATEIFGADNINIPESVNVLIKHQCVYSGGGQPGEKDLYKNVILDDGVLDFYKSSSIVFN